MTFGVAVGTFGSKEWESKAEKAVESAWNAGADAVSHVHSPSLAYSRNVAGEQLDVTHLCFLDADDCLEPGFFDGIKKVLREGRLIYKPSTRGYYPDGSIEETPSMIPWRDLSQANHLIIGCVINKSDFLRVGGFDGSLPALEDWDFFGRMVLDGCKVILAPEAVYGIYVNPKGRNSIIETHARAFKTIKINFAKNNKKHLLVNHMVGDHEDIIFRQL